jgi:predicted nucleic acid-binding Zn ribbon protein
MKRRKRRTPIIPHPCPVCGKLTKNNSVCSRECHHARQRQKTHLFKNKFAALDDTNRCAQCGEVMPIDRYSMYCEACEMHIEE